jgi:hypothetical protein
MGIEAANAIQRSSEKSKGQQTPIPTSERRVRHAEQRVRHQSPK